MRQMHDKLVNDISTLNARRDTIKAKIKVAKAQQTVNKIGASVAGADKNPDGDQNFSAYFNAAYDIACPGKVTLTPSVGISTKSYMYTGEKISGFTDISLKAAKEVKVTDSFLIPIFVQFIVSPVMDKTYLIFGMSF